jgi:tripartite-type tricarboxylate transporter receptor subunit TctC
LVYLTNISMNALVVRGDNPARTLNDLIDAAKRPGAPPIRYFSPGNGTSQHLSAVLLGQVAQVTFEHVPYRGPAEGLTAVLRGDVAFGFASLSSIMEMLADGRLRALGVTGRSRPAALPELSTIAELGYPRFAEVQVWTGIAVPKATPAATQQKLQDAIAAVLARPATADRFRQIGIEMVPRMTLAENLAFMETQLKLWEELVRSSGAKVD